MRVIMPHQNIRDSQPAGGTSWVTKSLVLLSLLGPLLVTGCMSPLHQAAGRNDINTATKLLDQGADVNERNKLNGSTALKVASSQGNVEMVKLLLDRGADVNLASGNMGWTALSNAAWTGQTEVAILLVERGADINKAVAGLNRGIATGRAIDMLYALKSKNPAQSPGPNSSTGSSPQPAATSLPPPADTATPF
jgi:ankyrin repeat protein